MNKHLFFILFAMILVLGSLNHKDDDSENNNDEKVCLIDAVGLGYPVSYSSYYGNKLTHPILNTCRRNACAWCAEVAVPG